MRLNPRTLPSLLPNNCAHPEHTYSRNFPFLEQSIKLIQPILADVVVTCYSQKPGHINASLIVIVNSPQ